MDTELTLDAMLLNRNMNRCETDFESHFTLIKNKAIDRFGIMNPGSSQKASHVRNVALRFASIYYTVEEVLTKNGPLGTNPPAELVNAVSAYVAANAIVQINRDADDIALENRVVTIHPPEFSQVDMTSRSRNAIDGILRAYCDYISSGTTLSNLNPDINYFFYRMIKQISEGVITKYSLERDKLSKLVVNGPKFRVKGVKEGKNGIKNNGYINGDDMQKKDFETIKLTEDKRVYEGMVVGNQQATTELYTAVNMLMCYRQKDVMNPFMSGRIKKGFKQGFLLIGDTGTGKTMSAFYAMTLAETIAEESSRDLEIVKFNLASSYQDGGIIALQHQIGEICSGEKIYVVFVDELDTKFKARGGEKGGSHYQEEKLGLFLQFLDGSYPNLGNYMILCTSNNTREVDRALKNGRLERIYCPGPLTPKEKGEVLAMNFDPHDEERGIIASGLDWKLIGDTAYELKLSGRNLRDVAVSCYSAASRYTPAQFKGIRDAETASSAVQLRNEYCGKITQDMIIATMGMIRQKDIEEQQALRDFRGAEP